MAAHLNVVVTQVAMAAKLAMVMPVAVEAQTAQEVRAVQAERAVVSKPWATMAMTANLVPAVQWAPAAHLWVISKPWPGWVNAATLASLVLAVAVAAAAAVAAAVRVDATAMAVPAEEGDRVVVVEAQVKVDILVGPPWRYS
jgi:hypothetical protein